CDTTITPNLCRQPTEGQPGHLSQGYDVLEFGRTDPSYSPVCLVRSYEMPTPPTRTSDLPRSAATITSPPLGATLLPPPPPDSTGGVITPTHIFCLQVP